MFLEAALDGAEVHGVPDRAERVVGVHPKEVLAALQLLQHERVDLGLQAGHLKPGRPGELNI